MAGVVSSVFRSSIKFIELTGKAADSSLRSQGLLGGQPRPVSGLELCQPAVPSTSLAVIVLSLNLTSSAV